MGRHHCCMSRQPPSPDGQPARVAHDVLMKSLRESPQKLYQPSPQKPAKIPKKSPRTGTSSWGSKYSRPEDAAELQAIFEDRDLPDAQEPALLVKKSSTTLNAVKNKISKRISRDSVLSRRSILSKRRSRLSVGASDEEIERRRELRDIREKRIREELSNSGIYDDDAKSFASAISLSALPEIRDDKVTLLADETLFPGFEWTPGKLTGSAIFAITGRGAEIIQPQPSPLKHKSTGGIYEFASSPVASSTRSRRHSFPKTSPESALDLLLRGEFRSLEAQPEIPPTPVLGPARLPSIVDSAIRRTSWRLSFASDTRARQLRALSQGSGPIPDVPAVVNLANPRAMKTWLRSQGLRIPSQALEAAEAAAEELEKTGSHADLCSQESEFGGVDGSEDNRPPVRLHEMQIHQRLASRGLASSISTPQMSTYGSQYDVDKLQAISTSICNPNPASRSRKSPDTSSSGITSLHIPGSWGRNFKDGVSSFYPSSNVSLDPTPETSRFNLDHLLMSAKLKGLYSSPKAASLPQLPIEPEIPQNTPVTNTSVTSLQIPFEHHKHRLAINDNSSLLASDTSSFRDRERALSLIKARFPELDNGNRGPSSPHISRFKEDFVASEATRKSSLLSALHISRRRVGPQRSYDGHGSIELTAPLRHQLTSHGKSKAPPSPAGPSKPSVTNKEPADISKSAISTEKTSFLWERALQMQAADERAEQVRKDLKIPERYQSKGLTVGFGPLRSLSWRLKGKVRPVYNDESAEDSKGDYKEVESEDMSLVRVRAKSRSLVDASITEAWIKELELRDAQAREATEASARVVSSQSRGRLAVRTSPKMWARFPSHTRLERTGTAKESDNIRSHDFAIRSVSTTGDVSYHTNERKHLHPHGLDKAHKIKHRSLPTRLGIGMRNTIYKLRAGRVGIADDAHGRKSSVSIGGELEYPELEIVRGPLEWRNHGHTGLERLELEVTNLLIREEREHRRARTVDFGSSSFDGSLESSKDNIDDKEKCEDLQISDPRFYDDCLFEGAVECETLDANSHMVGSLGVDDQAVVMDEADKRKTWHGRHGNSNWNEAVFNARGRLRSRSAEVLRRSTIDFARELMDRERRERERVLKAAELL